MSKTVKQYSILISAPADIKDEIEIIKENVNRFNRKIGTTNCINLITKYWRDDAFPETGDTPQNLLNKQIVDDSDAIIAIFWTRFGTPTAEYGSGAEEEIMRLKKIGKQIFLYFSDCKYPPNEIDQEQYNKIKDFKKRNEKDGLYFTYNDLTQFKEMLYDHLVQFFFKENRRNENNESSTEFNEKVLRVFNDKINNEINNAINELTSDNDQIINKSLKYIIKNHENNLSEIHLKKLYEILDSIKNKNFKNELITNVLSQHKSKYTDDFFLNNIWPYKIDSIRYFSHFGIENYFDGIIKFFEKETSALPVNFLSVLFGISINSFIKLVNYKPFADHMYPKYSPTIERYALFQHKWVQNEDFKKSYLHKLLFNINNVDKNFINLLSEIKMQLPEIYIEFVKLQNQFKITLQNKEWLKKKDMIIYYFDKLKEMHYLQYETYELDPVVLEMNFTDKFNEYYYICDHYIN